MAVSVETLSGLERKITVSVPAEKIEGEVGSRLRDLATKVKVQGFRPGKVPLNIVKQRYSDSVRQEVARDMVQSTLYEALKENELVPAGSPFIEPQEVSSGKDFVYTAVFEVFPQFDIKELDKDKIEVIESEVKDADLNKMLDTLREQHKDWAEVSRPVAEGDKVVLDFEGFLGNEPFAGGKAEGYEFVLGAGSMIPDFEKGIINAKKDEPLEIDVDFPADYGHADLAGKKTKFKILVKKVFAGQLPELNDEFAKKFNITEGGMEALKKDIKENMTRELERRVSSINRERIFDTLLEKNAFDLPKSLVDREIENLKHEMYHRVFGHEHSDNEKIPDFPRALFEEQAKRRVHLGLLFSEYVKKHQMSVEKPRVDAMIEKFASAYEKPDELRAWYNSSKDRLAELEALVMEEMVADKIIENATVTHKKQDYEQVVNPKKNDEGKGV